MLKIGSCTVLFNPDRDVISNVETYKDLVDVCVCLLYTSPSPRDRQKSRMPSSA